MSRAGQRTTTFRRAGSELVLAASAAAVAPPLVDAPAEAGVAIEGRSRRRFGRLQSADRVLLAAVAVAAGLRFWGFASQSLWYDEWLTAEAASGTLRHLGWYVTEQAGIPPTYFSFMWAWARVFGSGDAALRLPSVLAGIALVPVAYAAVRQLIGERRAAARIAALLVAVNPMLVWYSQEARPYSFLALLGTLSLLLLARARRTGRRGDLAWWSFVAALAIAVHYVAVFLVAIEVAVVLVGGRRPERRDLLVGGIPGALVLAALAPFGLQQFSERENHSWIAGFSLPGRLDDTARGALVGPSPPDHRLWIPIALAAVVAVALLVARGDSADRRAALVAGGFGLVPVGLALVAAVAGVDMIVARYQIVVLAAAIAAVAIGLSVTRVPRLVAPGVVALVMAVSVVTVAADARDPALQRPGWREVAEAHEAGGNGAASGAGAAEGRGERLLVVDLHGFLGLPLQKYLDGDRKLVAGEQATVRQIDVVVAKPTDRPCNLMVGLACALLFLGAPLPEPLAGRFELDERIDLDQFVLERYTAAEPVTVTPADIIRPENLADSLLLVTP